MWVSKKNWGIFIYFFQKAGVRARLSQLGVNYIATFLKDILIQQVLNVSPENEELTVQV